MSDLIKREDAVREMALMLEDISADLCEDILTRFGYDTPQELATEAMSIIPSAERKWDWIDKAIRIIDDMQREGIVDYQQAWEFRMRAKIKGAEDE